MTFSLNDDGRCQLAHEQIGLMVYEGGESTKWACHRQMSAGGQDG